MAEQVPDSVKRGAGRRPRSGLRQSLVLRIWPLGCRRSPVRPFCSASRWPDRTRR